MTSDNGNPTRLDGLAPAEKRALDAFEAQVEADLGPRGGHLVRIFIAVGVAATIVIAVVLARWGGGAATEPERVDEKAPVAAQDDSAKTAGIRLTYRVPKSLDEPEVGEISFIMRDRLEAIGVKAPVWIHGYRTHKINVNLSRDDRRKLALVKRVLVAPGRFHWAIEATEEELSDPRTGLGPDYDLAAFLHKEVMLAKSKRAYSPDRFGELFAGKVVNLYRNPENPTQPAHDGQKPAFIYYPPNRWKSGGLGNVEGRVRGPHTGAVVHVQESHVFRVAGFAELKAMIRQGTQCIWFELRADAKEPYFRFTRRHVKRRLCLIADGRMLTNPIIQGALPGTGLMTWGGNAEDFQVFAVSVRHGPLEVRPELISEKEVVTKRAKPKPAGK